MKIRRHSESHIVELDDGSKWQVFPGDLDVTLNWQPGTDLKLVRIEDEVSSHSLVSADDNSSVRVLPLGEQWPGKQVKGILKEGGGFRASGDRGVSPPVKFCGTSQKGEGPYAGGCGRAKRFDAQGNRSGSTRALNAAKMYIPIK